MASVHQRYRILSKLDAGGMAEIYRGVSISLEGFEKPVAIKRILPHLTSNAEFVDLLVQGGYRTMTVASDAASQRLRGKMMKGLRERHLVGAAQQARRAGMKSFKMYVILGLPDETDDDAEQLPDVPDLDAHGQGRKGEQVAHQTHHERPTPEPEQAHVHCP
jgi:hypothetical protein